MARTKTAKGQSKVFTPKFKRIKVDKAKMSKYKNPTAKLPEYKFVDTVISVTCAQTDAGSTLVAIAEGSDISDRVARKVTVKSVGYRLLVGATTADLATAAAYPEGSNRVRVALVYDKQPNGAQAAYNLVYQNSGTANAPMALRNMTYIERFDVLAVDDVMLCTAGPNGALVDRYIKCDLPIRFSGATTSIAGVQTGNFFLSIVDINGTALTATTVNGIGRLTFTDD